MLGVFALSNSSYNLSESSQSQISDQVIVPAILGAYEVTSTGEASEKVSTGEFGDAVWFVSSDSTSVAGI